MPENVIQTCIEPQRLRLEPYRGNMLIDALLDGDASFLAILCDAAYEYGIVKFDHDVLRKFMKDHSIEAKDVASVIQISESAFSRRFKNKTPFKEVERWMIRENYPEFEAYRIADAEYDCQGLIAAVSGLRSKVESIVSIVTQDIRLSRDHFIYVYHTILSEKWSKACRQERSGHSGTDANQAYRSACSDIHTAAVSGGSNIPALDPTSTPITYGQLITTMEDWAVWTAVVLCVRPDAAAVFSSRIKEDSTR